MAESARNAYATTAANAAAGAPNVVAVVNDGTADRQIVTLGKGDGTTGFVGDTTNPLFVQGGSTNAGAASIVNTFTALDAAVAAPDGTGTLISGTPTAGSVSAAFAVPDGQVASTFLIKGLTAAQTAMTVYFEASRNSTNGTDGDWVELKQRRTGTQVGVETTDYKTQANGYFRGNCAGFTWLRSRLLGSAFTAGATAQMFTSAGQGATFLNSGLPTGGSIIGKVGIDQTTPGTTNLVAISGTVPVSLATAPSTPVTGTFFQATQPVSLATNTPVIATGANTIGAVTGPAAAALALDSTQTNGTAQTKITDGTTVASNVAGDTGQNAQVVAGSRKEVSFTTTAVVATAATEVSNYRSVSVHIVTQGTSSSVGFQGSNDNTNWVSTVLTSTNNTVGIGGASTTSASSIFFGAISFRYFRLNITGISAGTTAGVIEFSSLPPAFVSTGATAAQSGIWTVGANSATGSAIPANVFAMGASDGTNLQAIRGNEAVTLLASAARTTTQTSADLINYNGNSAIDVILDMTVVGTGSVTVTINGKDPASGKYYLLLAGAAVTTNVTNVYRVGEGLTATVNSIANFRVPRIFQIVATANNANTATYSVGYNITRG